MLNVLDVFDKLELPERRVRIRDTSLWVAIGRPHLFWQAWVGWTLYNDVTVIFSCRALTRESAVRKARRALETELLYLHSAALRQAIAALLTAEEDKP